MWTKSEEFFFLNSGTVWTGIAFATFECILSMDLLFQRLYKKVKLKSKCGSFSKPQNITFRSLRPKPRKNKLFFMIFLFQGLVMDES